MARGVHPWGSFAVATVLSVAAYHLSIFGVVFLLPLEWVRQKLGGRLFLGASVLVAAGIVAGDIGIKALVHSGWSNLDWVLMGFPLVLIAGWVAVVSMTRLGWRFLYRLLAVTVVAGLVLFPVIAFLLGQETFNHEIRKVFDELWGKFFQASGFTEAGSLGRLDQTEFFELLKQGFLGSFLLLFFLLWGATGRLAQVFDATKRPKTMKDLFVPSWAAWILLSLWGLILVQGLLGRMEIGWDWGFAQYVVLNAAWLGLVVHALAGWGILHSLMDRWHWPRFGQASVRVLLVLLLLFPGTGQVVVLVGLPVLAVLELWVNFRKETQGVGL